MIPGRESERQELKGYCITSCTFYIVHHRDVFSSQKQLNKLGYMSKKLKAGTQIDTCMPLFVAALFTATKRWRQPKRLLIGECINKVWLTHTMEYYSALKRKESLTHAKTWMKLEDIKLSEISQSQKDKYLYDSTYMRYLE